MVQELSFSLECHIKAILVGQQSELEGRKGIWSTWIHSHSTLKEIASFSATA